MANNSTEENLNKINELIGKYFPDPVEKEETSRVIDSLFDIQFLQSALDRLPEASHEEFMEVFVSSPNDQEKIFGYLEEKVGGGVREDLLKEISDTSSGLIEDIESGHEVTSETRSEGKLPVK